MARRRVQPLGEYCAELVPVSLMEACRAARTAKQLVAAAGLSRSRVVRLAAVTLGRADAVTDTPPKVGGGQRSCPGMRSS